MPLGSRPRVINSHSTLDHKVNLAYNTSPVNTRHRPYVFDVGPTLDKCLIQMLCVCWELDYVTIANS